MSQEDVESRFPRLRESGYSITSPESSEYNCVAWAIDNDTENYWDPTPHSGYYWPRRVTRNGSLRSYIALFRREGFEPCGTAENDPDYEKVAIFADSTRMFKHAARQLSSGRWTSKLGDLEDIEHDTPSALEGEEYGRVVQVLRRPLPRKKKP